MIYWIIVLMLISFIPRVFPFIFAKQLQKSRFFSSLKENLPSCIFLLLLFYLFHSQDGFKLPEFYFQLAGISAVGIMHFIFHRSLLSIFTGFFVYQIAFRIFG